MQSTCQFPEHWSAGGRSSQPPALLSHVEWQTYFKCCLQLMGPAISLSDNNPGNSLFYRIQDIWASVVVLNHLELNFVQSDECGCLHSSTSSHSAWPAPLLKMLSFFQSVFLASLSKIRCLDLQFNSTHQQSILCCFHHTISVIQLEIRNSDIPSSSFII